MFSLTAQTIQTLGTKVVREAQTNRKMSTLSLKGLKSVCCEGMHGPEDGPGWELAAGERIAGWAMHTRLQRKANIRTTLQHQHPAAARIAVDTKDQLSKKDPSLTGTSQR